MNIPKYLPKLEKELRNKIREKKYSDSEQYIHKIFSNCITLDSLKYFQSILDLALKLGIFVDPLKIPDRFKKIQLAINESIQNLQLGGIISILQYVNRYNLSYRELNVKKINLIKKLKQKTLFMENLLDLFGEVSEHFIYFVHKDLPEGLYDLFIQTDGIYPGYRNLEEIAEQIRIYFNIYSVYGLSVKNLGKISRFLKIFKAHVNKMHNFDSTEINDEDNFLIIEIDDKTHLISENNIKINLNKMINPKRYNFYTYSMIFLGGLGPEGHGFSYSTPKGEIIEICSDRKESQAIIIKFKKYLKKTFLQKLTNEFLKSKINEPVINKIIQFIDDIISEEDYLDINKKESLIKKIESYLYSNRELKTKLKIENLIKEISQIFSIILRPVDLIDQFKCRMNLVAEGKIKSEEIPKLTSLKNKSHYDVLKERFFFQNIVELFFQRYKSEISQLKKK